LTDQPICDRCRGPIHDQAYVCGHCAGRLRRDLELVATVAGEASLTIARQDHIERAGSVQHIEEDHSCSCPQCTSDEEPDSALYPTSWPLDLGAAARHDQAVNQLITWVRHIVETRGIDVPLATGHPLAAAAAWLDGQLDWLRHQPYAGEAFDVLATASWTIQRVVDRPPEKVVVGQCPCGEHLYAVRGAAQVTCKSCGTAYDVETTRDELKRRLDQALFTAAELATLVAYFGEGQRGPVRKLINKWHERGLIAVHSVRGEPAYRFGEVVARLASSRRAS
jgi:hypothetical protein